MGFVLLALVITRRLELTNLRCRLISDVTRHHHTSNRKLFIIYPLSGSSLESLISVALRVSILRSNGYQVSVADILSPSPRSLLDLWCTPGRVDDEHNFHEVSA